MAKKSMKTKDAARQKHIQDLQLRAEEFVSDELSLFESEEMSQGLREQFSEHVAAYDEAELTTSFELLEQGGIALPRPEELDDSQLNTKLWDVIRGLAMLRMFLYSTDHLSDRKLYEELWHQVLREQHPVTPINENSAWHIDLVGGGSEEDIALYLRYYADEETRRAWAEDWSDDVMPAHETPPYDRDRHLPNRDQAEWRNCYRPS